MWLYQRSNWLISDFRPCDSVTLDSLHLTYCMHMYGCELWELGSTYINKFKVAWRQVKRRIWRLPTTSHNYIIHNLSNNIDLMLESRIMKFTHTLLNHCNTVCKQLLLSKLNCMNSTFARNYNYLCYKYELTDKDWYSDINYLLGKVKMKFSYQSSDYTLTVKTVTELCNIRNGNLICQTLSHNELCCLIAIINTE